MASGLLNGEGRHIVQLQLDLERRLAITELLAQSDPPELRRGHRLRLHGKPDRYRLLPLLSAVFVQKRLLALQEARAAADKSTERREILWAPRVVRQKEVLIAA